MNLVTIDIETQKLADEVGGWGKKHEMKIASAVLYLWPDNEFKFFLNMHQHKDVVSSHVKEILEGCDYVIGYNHKDFDSKVLYGNDFKAPDNYIDLLKILAKVGGGRKGLGLKKVSEKNLNMTEMASGEMAPIMWREQRFDELLQYNLHDVRMTWNLFVKMIRHRLIEHPEKDMRVILQPRDLSYMSPNEIDELWSLADDGNFCYC